MREGFHPQYVAEQRNLNYFRLNSGQNKKGELIGILTVSVVNFNTVTGGARLEDIKAIIDNNLD